MKAAFNTLILLSFSLILTACSSDINDKNEQVSDQSIYVNSLKFEYKNKDFAEIGSETITSKNYSIKACLSESSLGQKLDNRKLNITGDLNFSTVTNGDGCFSWQHDFELDYSGKNLCKVFKLNISVNNSSFNEELTYSIDTRDDELADLSKSKGCQEKNKLERFNTNRYDRGDSELQLDTLKFNYVGTINERRSDRTFTEYNSTIQSCLTDQVYNKPIRGAIKITVVDYEKDNEPAEFFTTTDEKGCFKLTHNNKYKQFYKAHWKPKELTIEFMSGHFEGKKISRNYYVNPWLEGKEFGIDSKNGEEPIENTSHDFNRLHIDQVMYIRVGNNIEDFKVNNYLGLTVSKTYQIVLKPMIDRGHYFSNQAKRYVPIPDGPYKMKFMLLAPDNTDIEINEKNFHEFTYLTGAEQVVDVKNGVMNPFVNLPIRFADMPRIATRTVSIFQLEPVNNTGLRGTIVTGYFKAKINWIRTSVLQSKVLQTPIKDLQQRFTENYDAKKHKTLVNTLTDQLQKGKLNLEELVESGDGQIQSKNSEDDENILLDVMSLKFKKYVDGLLSRLDDTKKSGKYDNPYEIYGDTPKNLYVKHLKKTDKHIKFYTSKDSKIESGKLPILRYSDTNIEQFFDRPFPVKSNKDNIKFFKLICRAFYPKKYRPEVERVMKQNNYEETFATKYLLPNKYDKEREKDWKQCYNFPKKYLSSISVSHTHKVSKTSPIHSNSFDFSIGSRVYSSYSTNLSEYSSIRSALDLGMKFPLGNFLTQGLRLFDVSRTLSEGQSDVAGLGDDVSTSLHIGVEKFNIKLDGVFEKCLHIRANPYIPSSLITNNFIQVRGKDMVPSWNNVFQGVKVKEDGSSFLDDPYYDQYRKTIKESYYLCSTPKKSSMIEEWYYTQTFTPDTALVADSYGPTEVKFIKSIRGRSHYNQYKRAFEDETKSYLYVDASAADSPEVKLYEKWGHIVREEEDPSALNKLLIENIEGSFPGTYINDHK